MKKLTAFFASAVVLLVSCQKASQDSIAPGTGVPGSAATGTVPHAADEPFSAKFTYSAPDINNIFENQSIRLEPTSTGVVSYVWKFDNAAKSSEKSPAISFPMHGFHTVSLTVTDKDGNTATSSQSISILCNFMGNH